MLLNELHPLNAHSPISVTLLGISMRFNEAHPLNVLSLILVTLLGISMLSNELQKENAFSPISVTLSGILNDVLLCFNGKRMINVSLLLYNMPSTDL